LAVIQLFSAENSLSFISPQGNNYWSFPLSTNLYNGSGGLELNSLFEKKETIYGNPFNPSAFPPSSATPFAQHNSYMSANSGGSLNSNTTNSSEDNQDSNPPKSPGESQDANPVSSFLKSLFSEDESTVNPNSSSSSCPGQ
jgi:hypothetical protein